VTAATVTCGRCGTTVPAVDGAPPLDWLVERDRGRVVAVCPTCTREHLRAIEGKLDQAWW
jgi:endogenous inhibitor of DNA gyrase (YacG/DUF329 family)